MLRALRRSTLLWLYLLFLVWESERPDAWHEVVLTAIPQKSDKVGFCSRRYISLFPVIQKFYTRAVQVAVRRERKPTRNKHLGQRVREIHCWCHCNTETVSSMAAVWCVGAFVASADVEGVFDCVKHDDVERALFP